ncbi:hypothetical protein ACFQDE_04305 [Deinococcus caeni]|uniref:Uncharacterized protein n=1 Tax=Deinococcus caeni TaxID=569127 RepID=A0ABP9UBJ4_9DEIO
MDLTAALTLGEAEARAACAALPPAERAHAAAHALRLGRPHLTLDWSGEPLLRAAAHLRLGSTGAARQELRGQPDTARPAVLHARAARLDRTPDAAALAAHAARLARAEGDGNALIAAAILNAEQDLSGADRAAHFAALRSLAEGLKVAELTGQPADPHLLAVLAHAQKPLNSRKAAATAAKALDRSEPGSPARVLALLALDRPEDAHAQAQRGSLAAAWWEPFAGLVSATRPPATTPGTDGTGADG